MSLKSFAAASVIALSAGAFAVGTAHAGKIDTNADGSISLGEAHVAASKKFDRLDSQHTGKLTYKQLPPAEKTIREMAHHDKDRAIDKGEYTAGVDAAFKEADPKGSGVLDAKTLKTKAAKHFLVLVE